MLAGLYYSFPNHIDLWVKSNHKKLLKLISNTLNSIELIHSYKKLILK